MTVSIRKLNGNLLLHRNSTLSQSSNNFFINLRIGRRDKATFILQLTIENHLSSKTDRDTDSLSGGRQGVSAAAEGHGAVVVLGGLLLGELSGDLVIHDDVVTFVSLVREVVDEVFTERVHGSSLLGLGDEGVSLQETKLVEGVHDLLDVLFDGFLDGRKFTRSNFSHQVGVADSLEGGVLADFGAADGQAFGQDLGEPIVDVLLVVLGGAFGLLEGLAEEDFGPRNGRSSGLAVG